MIRSRLTIAAAIATGLGTAETLVVVAVGADLVITLIGLTVAGLGALTMIMSNAFDGPEPPHGARR